MRGYYGDHPSETEGDPELPPLTRPLLLVGPPGAGVGSAAAALCSLTGWPLADLDRRIEHDAGRSLAALLHAEGARMLRAREAAALARALRESPPPVIAAGHHLFELHDCRRQAEAGARVLCLTRPVAALEAGLAAERARSPGAAPGVDPATLGALQAALRAQLPPTAEALDLGAAPPWAAARAVLEALAR